MVDDPWSNPDDPLWEETAEMQAKFESGQWNCSQDDPWWRSWLTSRQLFATCRDHAPLTGRPIHTVLGGTVFECDRVQVWVAPGELLVAYPSLADQYGWEGPDAGGLFEFEDWIMHLRDSPPLDLGRVRGRCSYGAIWSSDLAEPPVVKWAARGDWAACARSWYRCSLNRNQQQDTPA
jgi:hypothetical protein